MEGAEIRKGIYCGTGTKSESTGDKRTKTEKVRVNAKACWTACLTVIVNTYNALQQLMQLCLPITKVYKLYLSVCSQFVDEFLDSPFGLFSACVFIILFPFMYFLFTYIYH